MDPVSLVVAALVAGLSAGVGDVAQQALKDAYSGLKGLLVRRFGADEKAVSTLDQLESEPEVYQQALAKRLEAVGVGQDPEADGELVAAAQKVLAQADPSGTAAGKYTVTITGGIQGVGAGDRNTVTQTISQPPSG